MTKQELENDWSEYEKKVRSYLAEYLDSHIWEALKDVKTDWLKINIKGLYMDFPDNPEETAAEIGDRYISIYNDQENE